MNSKTPSDVAQQLTARYDRTAQAYEKLWAPLLRKAALGLLQDLSSSPARRIIDIGTGVGILLPDLQKAFPNAKIAGVDRSQGMLGHAPREFGLARMDADCLAVADGSADLALLVFMLFHLERPEAGLSEVRRIVGSGGRMGCVTWGEEQTSAASRIWTKCLDDHGASPVDPQAELRKERLNSPGKMAALLESVGFKGVRSWMGELVHEYDLESLLRTRTSFGASQNRFESMPASAKASCLALAEAAMRPLAPADFVWRSEVVYSTAHV